MKIVLVILGCLCLIVLVLLVFGLKRVTIRQPHLTFPKDENGDILRKMQAMGDNLDAARDMNFAFAFKNEGDAQRFASAVTAPDYRAEASRYEERKMWQTEVTHFMLLTYEAISELESRLSKIAREYGGEPDGWGSFMQP